MTDFKKVERFEGSVIMIPAYGQAYIELSKEDLEEMLKEFVEYTTVIR